MFSYFKLHQLVKHDMWSYSGEQDVGIVIEIRDNIYDSAYKVYWLKQMKTKNESYSSLCPFGVSKAKL